MLRSLVLGAALLTGYWQADVRGEVPFHMTDVTTFAASQRNDSPLKFVESKYRSLVWGGVDSLWLSHQGSDFRSEIVDPNSNAVAVSRELEHGFPVTPRVRVGSLLLDSLRTEVSFFTLDNWNATATITDPPGIPNLDATIQHDAELQNFEWNFLSGQSVIDTHWLLGVRYLRYRSSFVESYRLDPGFVPAINEVASGMAENTAIGPQIGIGLDLAIADNTVLYLSSKLGLMNNDIEQRGPSYIDSLAIDGTPDPIFVDERDEFLFLGDIELMLIRFLTRNLGLRIGYQGLFLDNVAQAAEQNGNLAPNGNVSFHGLVLGAECIW